MVLDWYPNAIHTFIYTAIERGYYADEGLDVKVRFPRSVSHPCPLPEQLSHSFRWPFHIRQVSSFPSLLPSLRQPFSFVFSSHILSFLQISVYISLSLTCFPVLLAYDLLDSHTNLKDLHFFTSSFFVNTLFSVCSTHFKNTDFSISAHILQNFILYHNFLLIPPENHPLFKQRDNPRCRHRHFR